MKKKAIKIAAASAVAASAFVAAAPLQSNAASNVTTTVDNAVKQMQVAYHTYSDVTAKGDFADINVVYKQLNAAKSAYASATALVKKAGGAQKDANLAKLDDNYNTYITKRVVTYIDAYNYAVNNLAANQDALQTAIDDKDLDGVQKAYNEISSQLKSRTVILDRVYGQTTRDLFKSSFKADAQELRDSMKYDVTVAVKTKAVTDAIAAGKLDVAKAAADQINEFLPKVSDTFKADLTTSANAAVAAYEAAQTPASTGVSVSAINDIPAGNLLTGSTLNKVFNFKLQAAADKALNVTALKVKEYGTAAGDSTDIQRVYLLDGETVLVSGVLNNGEVRLNKPFTIEKGLSKTLTVAVDVNNGAIATRTIQLGLDSVDGIISDADFSKTTFPIKGNSFTVLDAAVGSITTGASNQGVTTVKVGEKSKDLGNFTLSAGATEGANVNTLTLSTNGLTASNFDNLYLYDELGSKIDVKGVVSGNKVVFSFGDKALSIPKGQTKRFSLKGDILSGVNNAGTFQIANSYDVVAKGTNSNVNVVTTLGATPQNLTTANITVTAGTVALNVTNNVPSKVVATSSQAGLIREYTISAPSEDMTVDSIPVEITTSAANPSLTFSNVYITDENGNVIAGPKAIPAGGTPQSVTFTDVNWYIPAGQTKTFQVRATTATDGTVDATGVDALVATGGATVGYTLATTNTKGTVANAAGVSKKSLVNAGTLTLSNDATTPTTVRPVGSKAATVGKYLVKATDDNIQTNKLTFASNVAINNSEVTNFAVYVDGKQVGSTTANANGTSIVVDLSSAPLVVNKGETKQVELKADVNAAIGGGFAINLTGATTLSKSTSIAATVTGTANGGTITSAPGTLAVAAPAVQVKAANVLGDTETAFVSGKYTATNEDLKLKQVELNALSNTAGGTVVKNIKVYDGDKVVATYPSILASNAAGGTTIAIPLSEEVLIAAGSSKTLTFKGEIDKDGEASGEAVTFTAISTTGTKATGVSSNTTVVAGADATVTAGALTKRNALATVAVASDSPAGDSVLASNSKYIKFTITATGGDVYIKSGETAVLTEAGTLGTKVLDGADDKVKITDVDGNALTTFATATDTLSFTDNVVIPKGTTSTFYLQDAGSAAAKAGTTTETLQLSIGDGLNGLELFDGAAGTLINKVTDTVDGNVLKY